jgi:hypothetical protein
MNTNGLARHYGTLSPWERLPLMRGTRARGDDAEADRLARSAPKNSFTVPDYYGLSDGLLTLATWHIMEQLERAAVFWSAEGLLQELDLPWSRKEDKALAERIWTLLKLIAFRFVLDTDAWQLLCKGFHVDPEPLLRHLPGHRTLTWFEELARAVACTAEEATAFFREADRAGAAEGQAARRENRIDTAEDVAKAMKEYLESSLESWR